MFLKFTIFYEF